MKNNNQADHILDTAYQCIAKSGHAKISLRNIANEAGVALSQLHYYFGSKNALYRQLISRTFGNYIKEFSKVIDKTPDNHHGLDQLVAYMENAIVKDEALIKVFYDVTNLALWSEEFKKLMASTLEEVTELIEREIIAKIQLSPSLQDKKPKEIARLLVSILLGSMMQYMISPDEKEEISHSNDIIKGLILA